jgi:hypothetical protein
MAREIFPVHYPVLALRQACTWIERRPRHACDDGAASRRGEQRYDTNRMRSAMDRAVLQLIKHPDAY